MENEKGNETLENKKENDIEKLSKQNSNLKLILFIIIGSIVAIVVVLCIVWYMLYGTNKKLHCTSQYGDVTLIYNQKEIVSYEATGELTFNMEKQNMIAKEIGTKSYIAQFITSFVTDFGGYCK